MRLSTNIRYGVRALCDITYHSGGTLVRLSSISERQGISLRYLEQIFHALKKGGIVRSARGPAAGFYLARKPEDISVGDVMRAIDGHDIQLVACENGKRGVKKACARYGICVASDVWARGSRVLSDYASSVSIADIYDAMRARDTESAKRVTSPVRR